MTEPSNSFPERPITHVVGEAAISAFRFKRPQEWNITDTATDYGWDMYVEVPEDGLMEGLAFFVQLKGTDNPKFINENTTISFPLRVTTVKFLLAKLEPPMIAVCHTTDPEQPVYWTWLSQAVDDIKSSNSLWDEQDTVSIHIPTSNKITRDGSDIHNYVRTHHDSIRISQRVSQVLGSPCC